MTAARTTRPDYRSLMAVTDLPERKSGDVAVSRFTVDQHASDMDRITSTFASDPFTRGRYTPPGTYTALYRRGELWMSDTADERNDALPFVEEVERRGACSVLVNGLGLGSIIGGLVHVPSVEMIAICEIDPDVIALVGDYVRDLGLANGVHVEVRQGDAFTPAETWRGRPQRWDAAWHDIWPTVSGDDYEEHKRMRRIYGRRVGFQMVWAADQVRESAKRNRVYGGMWF